ncbi:MAG: hypothetical protein NTX25_00340 [Proteobacteria bacterium]|nr:hypothetical protein [Pseudomonadota bacterium]
MTKISLSYLIALMLLPIFGNSCTRNDSSKSFLKSVDDEYYQAARDYEKSAADLYRATNSLEQAKSKAESETIRVEQETISVINFLSNVDSDIARSNSETAKANNDAAKYRGDENASNVKANEYIQKSEVVKKDLRDIMQEVYILENKISIKEDQQENLKKFVTSIREYDLLAEKFTSAAAEMQSLAKASEALHTSWLTQFEELSRTLKPNFATVADLDSFKNAMNSISDFRAKIPSSAQVRGLEVRYAKSRENLVLISQNMRDIGYALAHSHELGVYQHFYPNTTITTQMDEMEQLSRDIKAVSLTQLKLHDKRNERRGYLSTTVPQAWEKLAKVNIQLNNEQIALGIIEQVERIISSQTVYNVFNKKVNDSRMQFYEYQRTIFAPRRSIIIVNDMLKYLDWLDSSANLGTLSPEMREQIKAEAAGARSEWQRNRAEVLGSLNPNSLPVFLKEWKRQAKLIGSRLKPTNLPDCKRFVSEISESLSGDAATEEAFIQLKKGC